MARSTLARHRLFRVLRDPNEGGGGGSGGQGAGGTGSQSGAGTGEGGAGGSGGGGSSGSDGQGQGGSDKGFPDNTPVADMTLEQERNYWKFHSKKHETRADSRRDYDDLAAKAAKWDEQQRSQMTPSEQALHDARETARKEERAAQAPRLVRAEFRAAAAGRQINGKPVNIDDLLEDVDLTRYLTDAGDVDTDKVSARLDKLAPAGQSGGSGGAGGGTSRHGAGSHRGTEGGKPDVAETRAAMEKALGRRPKRD